jgi:hypothetical protein
MMALAPTLANRPELPWSAAQFDLTSLDYAMPGPAVSKREEPLFEGPSMDEVNFETLTGIRKSLS